MIRNTAVLLSFAMASLSGLAQGFNNSSFESPTITGFPPYQEIFTSSVVSGFNTASTWNVVSGSVDVVRVGSGGYWSENAPNGSQILDLTGSSNVRGIIEQTINTGTLTSLNFSFNFSRNVDYNPSSSNASNQFSADVRIYAGSTNYLNTTVTIEALGDNRSSGNMLWQTFAQTVTVPANTNITLQFTDTTSATNSNNQGILLDNIQPVPEPVSSFAAVLGIGLLGRYVSRKF